jgi:hypothetical protein
MSQKMKLILATEDGTVIDSTDGISRQDLVQAKESGAGARALLQDLRTPSREELR